ncbi:hypothetical protein [Streptomyces sp. NPDC001221]
MAALLGATVPWLLTHGSNRPPAQAGVTGSSNGSGHNAISTSSPGQDGGDSPSGQDGGDSSSGLDGGATASPTSNNKTIKGNWFQQRGSLKLTVTQVDNQAGHIRLHIRADNGYADALDLALFKDFVATDDDTGHSYEAVLPSGWTETVPAGGPLSGVIELAGFIEPKARSLTISFNQIYGSLDAPNNIKVTGIPVPR